MLLHRHPRATGYDTPSLSPTTELSSPSPPEELSLLEELSLREALSPSPTAEASSLSPPEELISLEELSSLETPTPSPTAEASRPSPLDSKKVTFDAWITCLR